VIDSLGISALRSLRRFSESLPFDSPTDWLKDPFKGFASALNGIDRPNIQRVEKPREDTIEKWVMYRKGEVVQFTTREIRSLCWTPSVANSPQFREFLRDGNHTITGKMVRGLRFAYHAGYSNVIDHLASVAPIKEFLRDGGRAGIFATWRQHSDLLFGQNAYIELATYIRRNRLALKALPEFAGIDTNSDFFSRTVENLVIESARRYDDLVPAQRDFFRRECLGSRVLSTELVRRMVGELIMRSTFQQEESERNWLVDYVMKSPSLYDPRIHEQNWVSVPNDARRRFIEWLSREDIQVFFELLIAKRSDKQGRREFWLNYVNRIQRSRVLICDVHEKQHATHLRKLRGDGRSFGRIGGAASAFILDFGPVVVLEFTETGNACYIYRKDVFDDFFGDFYKDDTTATSLKRKDLVFERVSHSADWQDDTKSILTRQGIRMSQYG
jgi:hypothetical protein